MSDTEVARTRPSAELSMLRRASAVFAVALVTHGIDHLRRGYHLESSSMLIAGTPQTVLAVLTLVLVIERHRWAPLFAAGVGFAGAIGFTVVHLCPDWLGSFSDTFRHAPAARAVTGFSWFAAIFEITADLALGVAGARLLLRRA
jgi:hypothetical protein